MTQKDIDASPGKWYYSILTNDKGYRYIYAYQTKWDPVRKQARRSAKKYVGRLNDNDSVNIGATFRAAFPQFAEGTFASSSKNRSPNPKFPWVKPALRGMPCDP